MDIGSGELLRRLGRGESIAKLCQEGNISRTEFDSWWQGEIRRRTPRPEGELQTDVNAETRILRNRWGVPRILAQSDEDLFFGFGYAMAEDRLFQLDYLRRKGQGRLSEILGSDGVQLDTIARIVGLNRIAASEWDAAPEETRRLVESFSRGINALMDQSRENLPIEFALLDYEQGDCI